MGRNQQSLGLGLVTINILELRQAIEAAIGDQLGSYGKDNPAIWVEYPNAANPAQLPTGLECVIQPALEIPITTLQGGYQQVIRSRIVLKQWDETKTTLPAMLNLLEELTDYHLTDVIRIPRVNPMDNIETCSMTVTEYRLIQSADY